MSRVWIPGDPPDPEIEAFIASLPQSPIQADDYDFSGDCEPDCSCYRTECPELFCGQCNSLRPFDFIREQFPDFNNYREGAHS